MTKSTPFRACLSEPCKRKQPLSESQSVKSEISSGKNKTEEIDVTEDTVKVFWKLGKKIVAGVSVGIYSEYMG